MIRGLGGSIFVRDAFRLDYCLAEAVESLLPACEVVAVLDCGSTDGTDQWLMEKAREEPRLRVFLNEPWEIGRNYERFAMLANAARELLHNPWHVMLQADEVLHEDSYEALAGAVAADGWGHSSFRVRRLNLYGDVDRQVRYDSGVKPCSDTPVRLGRQSVPVVGDAENLMELDGPHSLVDRVWIHHYGFVRRGPALIQKVLEIQSWFHGPHATPDQRVVAMRQRDNVFRYQEIIPDAELVPLCKPHPVVARSWVESRRS